MSVHENALMAACHYWGGRVKDKKNLFAVCLMVVGGLWGWQHLNIGVAASDYQTQVGEVKTIRLEDGSQLTLGGQSAVTLRFSATERRIELRQGRLLVDVAKQANRPFVVQTQQGTATALGTVFAVHKVDRHHSEVVVRSSKVAACLNSSMAAQGAQPDCVILAKDQKIELLHNRLGEVIPVDAEGELAWAQGMVTANDMPLSALLALLNQNNTGHIYFNSKVMDAYRVSGVYALDQPEATLKAIGLVVPIRVRSVMGKLTLVDINPEHKQ